MKDDFADLFIISTCVNSTAILRPEQKGSSTEVALIKLVEQCQIDYDVIRRKYPVLLRYPFSSARKRMSTVIELKGQKTLFIKGASEIVLRCCSSWYNQETQAIEILNHTKLL
jgi:Ca2+ transporting ATPase